MAGQRQAEATGRRLRALRLPISRIIKSPLKRASQTADIIAKYLIDLNVKEEADDLLSEGNPVRPKPDTFQSKKVNDYTVNTLFYFV